MKVFVFDRLSRAYEEVCGGNIRVELDNGDTFDINELITFPGELRISVEQVLLVKPGAPNVIRLMLEKRS